MIGDAPIVPTAPAVEAMTAGVFTVSDEGALTGDPAVLTWMEAFTASRKT